MTNKVKSWLEDGTIDVFLGYKMVANHPIPHCFTRDRLDEVDHLVVSPARYSLEKIATHMAARDPDIKIGMLARDRNKRALNVLYVWKSSWVQWMEKSYFWVMELKNIAILSETYCRADRSLYPHILTT